MTKQFRLALSEDEKQYLLDLVRWSILHRLAGKEGDVVEAAPVPPSDTLQLPLGAFVTLKRNGALRGCIGYVMAEEPLYKTITRMAQAAAFEDPRFSPLVAEELEGLDVEISVLGPLTPCEDVQAIEIGRHGLIIRRGMYSGLLLPQVPVEWGWDRETFLAHTCRKAGLPENAWQQPDTQIIWFEAEVF